MSLFIDQAQLYAEAPHTRLSFYLQLAGTLLIVFSLMIFLGFFQLIVPRVLSTTLAGIGTLLLFIYYVRLNWQLTLFLTPVLIVLLWLSSWTSYYGPTAFSLWLFVICLLSGSALYLIGHRMDAPKPSWQECAVFLSIAPLYFVAELIFMTGKMKALQAEIHGVEQ